ncbi:MAG: NAD-dependent epimerase/dehydratase family protein [Bacteroidaceae bacterium]
MKILVTGANGYIGSNVVRQLLDLGNEVVACDINTDNIDPRAVVIKYDIFHCSDEDDMFATFGKPNVCLHLAWRDGFIHNSQRHMHDLSLHYGFLTNLINHGLRHLAIMGTMHEVGYHEGVIDENTPCNPTTLYSISKNALRQSVMLYAAQNNCTLQWLRAFYIYGDDLKNHSIFTKLLEAAKRGDKTFPFNTGKNQYDFMPVTELVKQIAAAILQDKVNGIINCCTGKPVPLYVAVEDFIKKNNLNITLNYGAFPDRPYDSPCIYGDNTKIKQIMNESHA